MTKAIDMIKNIIEDYLWYDGEVYPIVDKVDQVSYVVTGTRMGSYSGNTNWLKIKSVYAYKDYTITLTPSDEESVAVPDGNNNIVLKYISTTSIQSDIATVLATSAYITSAEAANGATVITADESVGTLKCGRFFVKRKEGGHPHTGGVDQAELYNIKLESDTEENVKDMVTQLRLLNNNINSYSYKWDISTPNYPFSLKFGDADDKANQGNNDFIITISLVAVSTL